MKFKVGDFVVVNDPTPYLVGRMFRVIKDNHDGTYKLAYIAESDRLEDTYDVVTRWSWNEKWLAPTDEYVSGDIDCDNLPDIMSITCVISQI